jgi:hypothetical protein
MSTFQKTQEKGDLRMKRYTLLLLALLLASPFGQAEPSVTLAATPAAPTTPATLIADAPQQGAAPQALATTLVMAMDRILPGTTEDKVKALLPEETRAVLNLYLSGQIRQWYFRQDRPGAIFLIEASSVEDAQKTVDELPLSKAGLLAYDLIPVGPYIPLATLLTTNTGADKAAKKKRRK